MARAKASDCAIKAMDGADRDPPITYKEEDCQGYIEQTVKRAGGVMTDYRGSNDMYRNACSWVGTLSEAKKNGRLVPGAVLFIVVKDGETDENYKRYKNDGLGNANHVGWYTGGRYEVVHSSASRGQVAPSTLKNAWTHVGWLKEVDYEGSDSGMTENNTNQGGDVVRFVGIVTAKSGKTVRMRKEPESSAMVLYDVPVGERVQIAGELPGWYKLIRNGIEGWMMNEFIEIDDSADYVKIRKDELMQVADVIKKWREGGD